MHAICQVPNDHCPVPSNTPSAFTSLHLLICYSASALSILESLCMNAHAFPPFSSPSTAFTSFSLISHSSFKLSTLLIT